MRRESRAAALVTALGLAMVPATAEDQKPAAGGDATQPTIEELEQRIKILEKKNELAAEEGTEPDKKAGPVGGGKDGLSTKSAGGDYQLRIRGYVQFDGRFFNDDQERPGIDTFEIRRLRLIFEGTVMKWFDFRFMPDFGRGTTTLQDGYADVRFKAPVRVRLGKFK